MFNTIIHCIDIHSLVKQGKVYLCHYELWSLLSVVLSPIGLDAFEDDPCLSTKNSYSYFGGSLLVNLSLES